MESVKKTSDYEVFKKRSGRYAVLSSRKAWINGDEKAKILCQEGLIKLSAKAKAAPEQEASAEETQEQSDDSAPEGSEE